MNNTVVVGGHGRVESDLQDKVNIWLAGNAARSAPLGRSDFFDECRHGYYGYCSLPLSNAMLDTIPSVLSIPHFDHEPSPARIYTQAPAG